MATEQLPASDGRRVRRDRNRVAVIDAMFDLLEAGIVPPNTEAIAERAGVSVSSVFRYFDGLDDLQRETIERYFERFAPLFLVPDLGHGALDDRVTRLVDSRLRLYGAIAPIARFARSRAAEHPRISHKIDETRLLLSHQIRVQFAPELERLSTARADDVVSLVDTLTSFESWDLQHTTHARSDRAMHRSWCAGVHALIDQR